VKFSELTALERTGIDTFAARIDPSSFIVRGPNGGFLAAVVLRALTSRVGDLDDPPRPPRSLTVHYARAPVAGPATVTTELIRVGRSLVTAGARLEQDGRVALAALGAFSPPWEAPAWAHHPHPGPLPAPDAEGLPMRDRPPLPFTQYWDHRFALGVAPGARGERAVTGGWLRLAEPEPVDAIVVAAMTDAWFPAAFALVDTPVPTVDLTIHFRTALPHAALGPEDFALVRFVSNTAADGFVEEDGELWAPDGTLVAQSRQLAILLPG